MVLYDKSNIFAKIIRGEIKAKKLYEDDLVLAFEDINPVAPIHILVIPKCEVVNIKEYCTKFSEANIGEFFKRVILIAEQVGLEDNFRLITNNGAFCGQTIFHFHVHILGGKKITKLLGDE